MMTAGSEHTAADSSRAGASLKLPTAQLMVLVPLSALITGGLWAAIISMLGYDTATITAGAAGSAVVAAVMLISVLVLTPWKSRPMDLWMTVWFGGLVLRLVATPVGAFLLYSATSLPAEPLALAVATAYLVTVLTETAVLARHVGMHS